MALPITSDQRIVAYDYDAANRPWNIYSPGGTFTFSYDAVGRRSRRTNPNGTQADYGYDDLGRLTSLNHSITGGSTILANGYPEYDQTGNIKTRTGEHPAGYLYDELYRLKESSSPAYYEKFAYDDVGNRQTGPGAKDGSYLYDAANQVTRGLRFSYTYDNNGNQTQRTMPGVVGKTQTLSWDNESRLAGVEKVKGTERRTVVFNYDPFGRRIGKKVTTVIDGVTKVQSYTYVYDDDDIIMELLEDDSGTTKTFFTHGPAVDEHLAMERNGQFGYYHADGLGSVVAITDRAGKTLQSYSYLSFGLPSASTTFRQSYTFTGREWDKETGLYYYRARYYDPMDGRFISKDPIGFKGGVVLYCNVENNSPNRNDPKGLSGASGSWSNGNFTSGYTGQDGVCSASAGVFNIWSCTKQCCKKHDQCYARHGCNMTSWLSNVLVGDGSACERCNSEAVDCIIRNIGKTKCDNCSSGQW